MMGLILIGVGLAVPDLPTVVAAALVFGTFVNPLLFVPLAFNPDAEKWLWYRLLAVVSFTCVSGGLVVAAIVGPGG
jgi:hydroxylaminobenzene mutase